MRTAGAESTSSRTRAPRSPALTAEVDVICDTLAKTRPTAVNLFWGIAQIRDLYNQLAAANTPIPEIKQQVVALASRLYDEDIANLRKLGAFGAALLPRKVRSSPTATPEHSRPAATAPRSASSAPPSNAVRRSTSSPTKPAPSSRAPASPPGSSSRTTYPPPSSATTWPATSCPRAVSQAVIVGADRIAANGDTANKIGTYSVAILAKEHGIPFYVAAPFNTIDLATATGDLIPIEQRAAREITHVNGVQVTPDGVGIQNPAFDVTPAKYITAIITERGVLRSPFTESIRRMDVQPVSDLVSA